MVLSLLTGVAIPLVAKVNTSGDGWRILACLATWLLPVGLALVAVGVSHPTRAHHVATALPLAMAVAVVSYYVGGFAVQFGGVGLVSDHPDLANLLAEWSPLDLKLGPGWGVIGLRGFLLDEAQVRGEGVWLFVSQLPLVTTAALLPLATLNGRVPRLPMLVLATLSAGVCYPLMGNWVRGGGWLSQLGLTLAWGHGYVDFGLTSLFLIGGGASLAGLLVFRGYGADREPPADDLPRLPPSYLPLNVLLGAFLAFGGWLATVFFQPMVPSIAELPVLLTRALLATGTAALCALFYGWLVRGDPDPALAGRAMVAALIVVGAGLPFLSVGAVLALGALTGILLAPLMYLVERELRLDDPAASVSVALFPAIAGLLVVGLWANGRSGAGWNLADATLVGSLAPRSALTFVGSAGVTGGVEQLQAQVAGIVALVLLGIALPLALLSLVARAYILPAAMMVAAQARAEQVRRDREARDALRRQGGVLSVVQRSYMVMLHLRAETDARLMQRRRPTRPMPATPPQQYALRTSRAMTVRPQRVGRALTAAPLRGPAATGLRRRLSSR